MLVPWRPSKHTLDSLVSAMYSTPLNDSLVQHFVGRVSNLWYESFWQDRIGKVRQMVTDDEIYYVYDTIACISRNTFLVLR